MRCGKTAETSVIRKHDTSNNKVSIECIQIATIFQTEILPIRNATLMQKHHTEINELLESFSVFWSVFHCTWWCHIPTKTGFRIWLLFSAGHWFRLENDRLFNGLVKFNRLDIFAIIIAEWSVLKVENILFDFANGFAQKFNWRTTIRLLEECKTCLTICKYDMNEMRSYQCHSLDKRNNYLCCKNHSLLSLAKFWMKTDSSCKHWPTFVLLVKESKSFLPWYRCHCQLDWLLEKRSIQFHTKNRFQFPIPLQMRSFYQAIVEN